LKRGGRRRGYAPKSGMTNTNPDAGLAERIRDETLAQVKEMMDAVERRHGYEFFDRVLAEAYAKAVADKVKAEAQAAWLLVQTRVKDQLAHNYLEQLRKLAENSSAPSDLFEAFPVRKRKTAAK